MNSCCIVVSSKKTLTYHYRVVDIFVLILFKKSEKKFLKHKLFQLKNKVSFKNVVESTMAPCNKMKHGR